jgi:ABC-2 type transport system ATP-binding protein
VTVAIEVEGLTRRYGSVLAVDDLSFSIQRGECVAMLGPNGAGKSTTIEILEGYRHRDAGEVSVLGSDPQRASRHWRSRVGIVPQGASDMGDATVAEAISLFGALYPSPRTTSETIAMVGLEEQRDTRLARLSGGQRRRVDVALGIVGRPELLFLDEPTTGFDPEARHVFWNVIAQLRADGTTIMLTTHYLEEADQLADRVIVIAGGRKVADTTPAELGIRHGQSVRVSWRDAGQRYERVTDEPTALLRDLMTRFEGEIPGLEVTRVSLEEAYLDIIGHAS